MGGWYGVLQPTPCTSVHLGWILKIRPGYVLLPAWQYCMSHLGVTFCYALLVKPRRLPVVGWKEIQSIYPWGGNFNKLKTSHQPAEFCFQFIYVVECVGKV